MALPLGYTASNLDREKILFFIKRNYAYPPGVAPRAGCKLSSAKFRGPQFLKGGINPSNPYYKALFLKKGGYI